METLTYAEGLLVGYRGYDRDGREPLFCFGHGLGYTDWTYDSVASRAARCMRTTTCRWWSLCATQEAEAAARSCRSTSRPTMTTRSGRSDHWLGFATVDADAGQSVEARVVIPSRAFARFDGDARDWVWRPGTYTVRAGRSSRDLRVSAPVQLEVP